MVESMISRYVGAVAAAAAAAEAAPASVLALDTCDGWLRELAIFDKQLWCEHTNYDEWKMVQVCLYCMNICHYGMIILQIRYESRSTLYGYDS
jgi:hypothetical protein